METPEQQRRPAIGQFAKTLANARLDFDAIDLADMLWLAQFIEPAQSVQAVTQEQKTGEQPKKTGQTADSSEPAINLYSDDQISPQEKQSTAASKQTSEQQSAKPKGTPFSVPAAPALRTRLDLARSLRPLMRKVPSRTRFDLDEDATVTQIAETEVWMPVVRPSPERWLELELVVEASKTTVIWERAIAELHHLAEYQGAFRAVRTWRLSAQAGKVQLFPRWQDYSIRPAVKKATNQRPHTPGELIDPTGRRLVWLVTDCTSLLWRQDIFYETLLDWAKEQPIAIVQMFPDRLWSRTTLRDGHIVRLGAGQTRGDRPQLEIEGLPQRLEQRKNTNDLVTVPIITLEAAAMLRWARVAAGFGATRTPGRTFDRTFIRKQAAEIGKPGASSRPSSLRTAQERVALFRSTASKTAQQLADLMAAAPVSLPVVDLLRDAFRADFEEEVQQFHVAEVLLSGLLRRCDTEEDEVCRYEFFGDGSSKTDERVRDILLGDASISKSIEVLNVLSDSICRKLGSPSKSFQALLAELQSSEGELRDAALPFARVGLDVLHRLGGEYAALAQRYESGIEGVSSGFDPFRLEDLEYEVAKLINFPPLQPCEYESGTITAILDRFDFETACLATPFPSPHGNKAYQKLLENYLLAKIPVEADIDEFFGEIFSSYRDQPVPIPSLWLRTSDRQKKVAEIVKDICHDGRLIDILTNRLSEQDAVFQDILLGGAVFRRRTIAWGYTESLFDASAEVKISDISIDASAAVGLDMIAVPGGSFIMGAPKHEPESTNNERPQHEVMLQPFYLGRYPVTQAQWKVVAGYERINLDLNPDPSRFKGAQRPVEGVSWNDAQEFCQRLSAKTGKTYCLPSEAEWEYACRAGTETPFHFGEKLLPELANYNTESSYNDSPTTKRRAQTTNVGSFPANEWGLYDMHGNVWEWCEDDYHSNYDRAPKDGSAWVENDRTKTGRVLRGGSWSHNPRGCRSAYRDCYSSGHRDHPVGFRVCCVSPRVLPS